jgi:SNF2 family DNA or RNA helicase
MNPIEKNIYEAILTKIRNYGRSTFLNNIDLIQRICKARIIRLKQAASYVRNLDSALHDEDINIHENLLDDKSIRNQIKKYDQLEKPAKLIKLISMVKNLKNQNKKVLVWSTHLKTINLILKALLAEGIVAEKIVGKTDLDKRRNIKEEFNLKGSSLDVIVALPQACSESISLHKACHNAIYYDLNYNAAEFLQSLDRIHRVGGSEMIPVEYDFLHYVDTVDVKVYEKVFKKADRQMQIIEEENLTFDLEDIEENWETLYNDLSL